MKKLIIVAALALFGSSSVFAAAAAACAGTAGKVTITGQATAAFIVTTFATSCSNNVLLNWDQNTTAAWGEAGSNKGACYQMGHTDAGVRPKTATCGASAPDITGGTANPAAGDAANMGSS